MGAQRRPSAQNCKPGGRLPANACATQLEVVGSSGPRKATSDKHNPTLEKIVSSRP